MASEMESKIKTGALMELAMVLMAPAAAYLGFRSFDKWKGGVK